MSGPRPQHRLTSATRRVALLVPVAFVAVSVPANASPGPAPGAWTTSATAPFGVTAQLFGVAARSGQAWAVGGSNPTGAPPTQVLTDPYAERFDGTRWLATPVPAVTTFGTGRAVSLRGVAAVSTTDVWGVGSVEDLSSSASRTLAFHWDGSSWTRSATPNPSASDGNHLRAVAAQSSQAVYAVGDTGHPSRSLVLRYDGSTWKRVAVPDYGPLVSVTADSTGIWVAGTGVVARYDGSTWLRLPSVPAGLGSVRLTGITGGASGVWVVGDDQTSYFEGYFDAPYAARFRDGRWTKLPVFPSGYAGPYTGVVSDGATAWATTVQDTVVRYDPGGATLESTPAPGRLLNAVAADPAGRQWAVGGGTFGTGGQPAIISSPASGS
jgi:hypothetical protein